MDYQKIIHLLDNMPNQPFTFRTNLVEINDDACETYNTNRQIKSKTSKLKVGFCDYSDAYTFLKEAISIAAVPTPAVNLNDNDKEVVFKNCA